MNRFIKAGSLAKISSLSGRSFSPESRLGSGGGLPIASVHKLTGRIIDPHTAVGMAAAQKMGRPASPVVILSTAHPAKFPEAVAQAIGVPPPEPAGLSALRKLPERVEILANSPSLIKNFIFSRLAP